VYSEREKQQPPVPRTQEYWGYYTVPSNYYGGAAHTNTSKEIETNNEIDGHIMPRSTPRFKRLRRLLPRPRRRASVSRRRRDPEAFEIST